MHSREFAGACTQGVEGGLQRMAASAPCRQRAAPAPAYARASAPRVLAGPTPFRRSDNSRISTGHRSARRQLCRHGPRTGARADRPNARMALGLWRRQSVGAQHRLVRAKACPSARRALPCRLPSVQPCARAAPARCQRRRR